MCSGVRIFLGLVFFLGIRIPSIYSHTTQEGGRSLRGSGSLPGGVWHDALFSCGLEANNAAWWVHVVHVMTRGHQKVKGSSATGGVRRSLWLLKSGKRLF